MAALENGESWRGGKMAVIAAGSSVAESAE